MPFHSHETTRRRNAQQKIRRYCTCGRKFVGNLGWASHLRWAERTGVAAEHRYAGTRPSYACTDCLVDTDILHEFYMVHDSIWSAAVSEKPAVILCIGCLETRLGRELTATDFKAVPLNTGPGFKRSDRFADRLSRRART